MPKCKCCKGTGRRILSNKYCSHCTGSGQLNFSKGVKCIKCSGTGYRDLGPKCKECNQKEGSVNEGL